MKQALTPHYQPYWCEENIWHLAQNPAIAADQRVVLAITGAAGPVGCWKQKAGVEGDAVAWDYHVVLATKSQAWSIWDLDTRLGFPVPAQTWLNETFPYPEFIPRSFHPRFAAFEAAQYVADFNSDRSHMRGPSAGWLKPPPPWPAIRGNNLGLQEIIQQAKSGMCLEELRALLR